jgi:hypothetical protein
MPKIVKANGKTFTFDDNVTNDQISSTIDEYFGVKKKEVSQLASQKTPSASKSKRTTTSTSSATEKTQAPVESDGLGGTPNINIPMAAGSIPLAIPALFSEATKTVYQAADDALVAARKSLQEQGFFDDDIPDTKTPVSDAIKKKVLSLPNGIQQMKDQETGVLNPAPYIKGAAELGLKIINSTLPQEQKNVIISALNLGDAHLKSNLKDIQKVQDYSLSKDNIPVNVAKNIIGMAPDLVVAAAMENPTAVEGRLTKMATEATKNAKPILQKLVPKTAKFIEEAVNAPFTKIMAAKGALSSVANAKEGENIVDKGFEGGLEGAAEGVYMHTLGAAAGKAMPFIAKGISKAGVDSAFATAIANPLANAGVFTTAKALRTGIEEQRLISPEEAAMEAGTGIGFSLLHAGSLFKNHDELNHYADNVLKTNKLDSFKRVVNETKDNLDLVYNPDLTPENISKLEEARNDLKTAIIKEPDLENKQILINEALKIQNQLDAHSAINDIVNNKESLIDTVNSNDEFDENQKDFYTKKIEAIADYFDTSDFGLKKKELNVKIDEAQKLLDDASNKFTNRKSASDGIEAKIELDNRREELDKLNSELTDLITNKLKPIEEVVTEEVVSPIDLADEYIQSIEKVKTESPEKFWSVDRPFQKEDGTIDKAKLDKSAEEGRIIKTESGFGVVGEDGDIKGVFKSDLNSTEKTGDKVIQEAIKKGGIKLDNFALPNLMKIYERNGFREVSRLPFNEEYAPEGWTPEQGTPDVVAMVYDPKGELNIEKKSFTDYDEAMKYRDSYVNEVKPIEVKPTIKSKLEAFKAKHIDKQVYDRSKLDTQVENAKKSLAKVLPNIKFVVHDTVESFVKEAGKNARGYYDPATGTIHINALEANARTVAHEVFHSVLLDKVKTDANARDLTKRMIDSVSKTLEGNPELKKTLDDFVKNYDENIQSEEKVAELFGHLADGYEGFDAPTKSIIKRAMDRLAKMFGLQPFTEGEVVDMLKTLAGKVATGEEIVAKDVEIIKEQKIVKDAVKKFQADFTDPKSKVEFVYDKNTEKFKKLEEEGYITKDMSIEDFNGQTIFLHQPDAAFSGEIYKNGEPLVEGKGGVYYPIKFHDDGYFWASTETTANKMAKDLNAAREANGGKLLMALTSAPSDKLLSSTTAANGVMEIISSKAFDKSFSLNKEQVKKSLVDAANKVVEIEGKKVGLGLGLKKGANLEDVKSEISKKLNPDNSSFADRKAFVKSFISNIADIVKQNPKAVDQFGKFFSEGIKNESFKGVTKTGKLSISAANMTQAISEMLTEPMLKEGIDRNKGGQVYAILELNGDVKPINSDKHESYPKAIQSVDPNNKVKLHILKDRVQWSDVFEDPTTGNIVTKERQLNIFPTSGVSTEGLKLNTNKGRTQESEDYSDMKDIVKDMIDEGMSISEIKKSIGSELGPDQVSLAERAHNELTAEPKTTSIKNEVVSVERKAKGLAPVEQRDTYSTKANYDETKAKVDSGEISPRDLATAIIQNPKSVAITSEVSDALAYDRMRLSNEYDKVIKDIVEDPTNQANIIARDRLEKEMEDNDRASKYSGTISSHALLARKNVIKQDYSLDRLIMRYKAETGGKISEDMRAKFDVLSNKLQEANAKLEQYESKIADRQVKAEFEKIKRNADKEVRSNKRSAAKESLKTEREDLYAKLKEIQREQMSKLSVNPLPLEMVPVISKLAKNLIKDGIVSLDGVVDEIHSNVKDIFEDITKRDIRDALSGYGKFKLPTKDEVAAQLREIKSQARLISALEDAESGKTPLKTGYQRGQSSDTVRELQRKVQEVMKQNNITTESLNEESTWKSALDGIKTRLKNQIKDLEKQIATGEKSTKKTNVEYDEEAKSLKEQRDDLKKIIEEIDGKKEMTDEQKTKNAISAVERSISEYERRIKERDISAKPKVNKVIVTPELKALRDVRENLKEQYNKIKEEINPRKTPEEKALNSLKTRLKNREKELQGMFDSGNFEKKPRNITVLDSEANKLKADIERIKNKVDIEIKKERLKNRTKVEKVTDFVTTWRRNLLLTGVKVLGKLTAAAGQRTLISPIEELVGGVLSKLPILSKVSEKAPREGGINAKAEVKAISQWWQKATYKDMREIVKSGKGALDLLHGKKTDLPPSVFDFFGQMHQALKQPAKRNEYFRSFEKRLAFAERNGVDISDPLVQATIGTQAYLDANRAIFMQENSITTAYKSAVNTLERAGDSGKVVAGMLKVILPIVKVPTNFANEVTSYSVGGLKGLLVLRNGIKDLTPDQADYVMRNLKKQSLGAAVIALGYFLSGSIGGFYQRGDKRDENDVQAGGLRVLGVDMPKWMIHTPLLEMLQIGATLKRVQDDYENKEKEGTAASVLAATKGVVEEVPFARSPEEALKALSSPDNFKKYFRDLGESMINPQLTKEIGLEVLPKENKDEESYGKETGVRK